MESIEASLEIINLTKTYTIEGSENKVHAVKDVSFVIKKGGIFGLLGPNGAGKTSIISCITNLEQPTSGKIKVFGNDVNGPGKEAKIRIGLVPQEIVSHGFFNIIEILTIHSGYYGRWKNKERIDFLVKRLGLWEHRHKKVKHLSGGMKRRLLIAKALVHEPQLLLLDEPTAGVDIELREDLWSFVKELRAEGITVLLTTHYLEEAEELCDRVGIIQKGELKKIGETKQLIKDMTQREVSVALSKDVPAIEHEFLIQQNHEQLQFRIPSNLEIGSLISQTGLDIGAIKDLEIREGDLEEAFRNVLGGQ